MMIDCLFIGDSIAAIVQPFKPECGVVAAASLSSVAFNVRYHHQRFEAKTVVISLGTNDQLYAVTRDELMFLRERVSADRVVWIMPPIKPAIRDIVRSVAGRHGDGIVEIPSLQSDRVHPDMAGARGIVERIWRK